MHATTSLRRRNSLNAVAASLVVELCQIGACDLNRDALTFRQAGNSAELASQLDVCCCEVFCEQLGVVSAFGGADFQNALHGCSLVEGQIYNLAFAINFLSLISTIEDTSLVNFVCDEDFDRA